MSAWRREASERLPELQSLIAARSMNNPMALWIELHYKFQAFCAAKPPQMDLIKRIWAYAVWSMEMGNEDVRTAAALGFCEHLIDSKASRTVLPLIMSRKKFIELKDLLLYHNTLEEFEEVLKEFDF